MYKKGILLVGGSGQGKSTIYQKILQQMNIDFVEITAGSDHAREQLRKAYLEDKVVILDELNLDERIEDNLNAYMDGYDRDETNTEHANGKAIGRNFMVLSSMNNNNILGRKVQPSPLINRFHMIHVNNLPAEEFVQIAMQEKAIQYPELFVASFIESSGQHGNKNPRHFFEAMSNYST